MKSTPPKFFTALCFTPVDPFGLNFLHFCNLTAISATVNNHMNISERISYIIALTLLLTVIYIHLAL